VTVRVFAQSAQSAQFAQSAQEDPPPWIRACAERAASPWAAPLDGDRERDATYLLDLACARECSQADAVGYASASYAYATYLDLPGLARRELLGTGALDVSHGLRLFSVS
jgi:hypothetical protein